MVGINTVITDNPSLTTRLSAKKYNDPIRVIIDSKGRLPLDSNVIKSSSNAGVILATTSQIDSEKEKHLIAKGVTIIKSDNEDGSVNLIKVMEELHKLEIDSVLLEGGGTINASALSTGIVDKVIMFIAPKIIGGKSALSPVEGEGIKLVEDAIRLHDITINRIDDDIVYEGYIV
jgi:diaminohydroxyphosphoribosylaminopyrimidine deaminase/5-amino-6-(5-phosphoribosylamino)uracil reductase